MVTAFEGWNDAADAATDAVEALETGVAGQAARRASTPRTTTTSRSTARPCRWSTASAARFRGRRPGCRSLRLAGVVADAGRRDIVLVRGLEPNMRWRGFLCRDHPGRDRAWRRRDREPRRAAVGLPAQPAGASNRQLLWTATRPAVSASTSRATKARPASSASSTTPASRPACPTVSLWAAVPHYVAQPPCPKATLALLRNLEDVIEVPIPYGDLVEMAAGLGTRRRPAGRGRLRGGRLRPHARTAKGRGRSARGERRSDRPRVRAVPAPPAGRRILTDASPSLLANRALNPPASNKLVPAA